MNEKTLKEAFEAKAILEKELVSLFKKFEDTFGLHITENIFYHRDNGDLIGIGLKVLLKDNKNIY